MRKTTPQPQIIPTSSEVFPLLDKNIKEFLSKRIVVKPQIEIVYFGTPQFSAYILERLIEDLNKIPRPLSLMYQVKAVVTSPDKPVGRRQTISQSPVSKVAQKYNVPVLKPKKLDNNFITTNYQLLTTDLYIVVSYGQILPQTLLDIPKLGAVNLHGSVLPKYRGASPIQQAILNGDKETGITIIKMDEKLDHGPILVTKKISVSDQDTFESLSNKMMLLGVGFLLEILPKFVEGRTAPKPQNHAKATYCERLTRESGYFDISDPTSPQKLDRMIRAYYPWPGVWTRWNGRIVKLYPEGKLQMEGKKAIPLADFLNGYPDFPIKVV